MPASAPIDISPLAKRARYTALYELEREPKTSLRDRPNMMVPPLRVARRQSSSQGGAGPTKTPTPHSRSVSNAQRRASYAARDMRGGVDPGPIFELGTPPGEDDEDFEGLTHSEKARRMAAIMQGTKDGLPDAGMWRSLADS